MFQYPGGRLERASYGAGTATQVVLRMLATYRGAVAWELQAGSGEVVIAPLFEVLKQRGVKFHFFHKLSAIALSLDQESVAALQFNRQVDLRDPNTGYDPIVINSRLRGFSAAPDWQQIKDGEVLENERVDLESFWCDHSVGMVRLEREKHFDDVILAVPIGALKPCCGELMAASGPFRTMATELQLVPSLAVQLWCSVDLLGLGWPKRKPALVSGPKQLNIWADMSQVLSFEPAGPRSLHYLCDVFPSDLYLEPADATGVQQSGQDEASRLTKWWLERRAHVFWPTVARPGDFDWSALFVWNGSTGAEALREQYIHANINPSDCCVATAAGTSKWRLRSDQIGIDHLYVAGSWIDTGFNTECVETAGMSGMQAARAISGVEREIVGETFLHAPFEYLGPCDLLRRYVRCWP
jgi:uncharacterized protein with NAD-binding domain and iron-sulfur cluster